MASGQSNKMKESVLSFTELESIDDLKMIVFIDVSFANLPDHASNAYVILFCGRHNKTEYYHGNQKN